jgi:hypothetical protein
MSGVGNELIGISNLDLPQLLVKITDLIYYGAILVLYRSAPDETYYYDSLINDMTSLNTL